MKLNRVERALMNNPLRAALQRFYEGPLLRRLGGGVPGGSVLEVGCGRGVGAQIILSRFGASRVWAFDLDLEMVELAKRRLAHSWGPRVRFFVGDAAAIPAPDACFDAVFDFGIVHHVPEWRRAVSEIARVLRPGGTFFFEEVTRQALARLPYRALLDHPVADRFAALELLAELERDGIAVGSNYRTRCFGDFVIGVGRRCGDAAMR
jgi:ubiquinone/menaquinone biosynthesis C-methylase UbiE